MPEQQEKPLYDVTVEEGKYRVVLEADGRLHALRYGEPWRDLTGDKLVGALIAEIEELRASKEEPCASS